MKKTYQFRDKRGECLKVEAETILDAKKKVKEMGGGHLKFSSIKLKV